MSAATPPISRITAEHYRSFEKLDLELRPLTLIYGDNSAGKSALLRLLPLVAGSLGRGSLPLDMTVAAAGGSGFEELIGGSWRANDPTFRLGLAWEDTLSVQWNLGAMPTKDARRQELLDIIARRGLAVEQGYSSKSDLPKASGAVPLATLGMERLRPRAESPLLRAVGDRLGELIDGVAYLGPRRADLPRILTGPPFEGPLLQSDGSDALAALSAVHVVETEVADWLRQTCQRSLLRDGAGDQERWTLSPLARQELRIPLAEAGIGMAQLLPELVALALRASPRRPEGARYLCFEEPATHLHERLQVAVGQRLAAVAAEPDPVRVLVETHSRPLLTGVQLAIAKGILDPARVVLHWIEQDAHGASIVTPVTFDAWGFPIGERLIHTFQAETQALAELADLSLQAWG